MDKCPFSLDSVRYFNHMGQVAPHGLRTFVAAALFGVAEETLA
jgi:hypothetical protein